MVNIALDNILPQYKKILGLKYFQRFSYKKIAEILNKTESAVQNQLYRARKRLKKEIQKLKIKGLFD